ncbi:MAG TPA: DUF5689 domain-containing protein, partial [Flavobacteriales bacterium]|nr:DUF5689 domain-containing protein [Flavobacteriales bacterium]
MITKHINRLLVALPFAAALFSGCKKEFDSPPRHTPAVGEVITIAELKAMFTGAPVHFNGPRSVYATVNSDENDGNFYKNVYVQDSTGGLCLRLLNSGGLYIGDSIRIYLPGTVLSPYNGLMQLDSVDVDRNTVKQATLRHIEPLHLTIGQLDPVAHQSMLVRLDSVEFVAAEAVGSTWADAVNSAFPASQARGDVLFRGASTIERLAAGTKGQFLCTQGAAADPK